MVKNFISFLFILSIVGCFKGETIKVGFVGSLTGRYSEIGIDSRNSIKQATDEWNKKGGIKGKKLELIIKDDCGDPDSGIKADDYLIKSGCQFIIGHYTSNMTPAVHDKKNANVLFISPTMSTSQLSIEGDNFIRVIPPCSHQSILLANAINRIGYKKCFIIFDSQNSIYTKDVMSNFIKKMDELKSALEIKTDSIENPSLDKFSRKADEIVEYNPDVVLIITNGIDFANLAQQLRRKRFEGNLFGPRWASTKDVITHGGRSVEGAFFTAGDQGKDNSKIKNHLFYENYKERYGKKPENFIPVFAYDAANILFEGMKQAKKLTPINVRNTILEIGEFNGVDEVITIDKLGDASRSISLVKIKDGVFINAKDEVF